MKTGMWDWRFGFTLFLGAVPFVFGGAGLAALAFVIGIARAPRMGSVIAILAFALCLAALAPPFIMKRTAQSVPPIHDITTDWRDPPAFDAAASERAPDENSLVYAGAELAEIQQRAYPDIAPVLLRSPPDEAFALAQRTAEEMGWDILSVNRAAGRIEAVATTWWWGFKDDVVVRISDGPDGGARIDIRSASRVGTSDIGANAKRIRAYSERLRAGAS
ncbi:MAG: DUF1499 domain-containing protein [Pseudomonadota bacterium]